MKKIALKINTNKRLRRLPVGQRRRHLRVTNKKIYGRHRVYFLQNIEAEQPPTL
jgi:hypothetical protein